MRHTSKTLSRRGVVLMIVMVLLATFAIVAMTFLLSTMQMNTQATTYAEIGRYTNDGNTLVQDAVMILLRGDKNAARKCDSLLGDMFGDSSVSREVTAKVTLSKTEPYLLIESAQNDWLGRSVSVFAKSDGTGGPLDGLSGFVVKVNSGMAYVLPHAVHPAVFSDGGNSYDMDVVVNPLPYQGSNRDYDAPDEHNEYLTARNPVSGQVRRASFPFLEGQANQQRRTNIRNVETPPSGAKPTDSDISKIYDVDSDNDGKPDSVWLDVGFPLYTGPDGRKYKPLAAYLVEDMDGRFNPNAQGQELEREDRVTPPFNDSNRKLAGSRVPAPGWDSSASFLNTGYWGSGRGPAEVALTALALRNSSLNPSLPQYTQLDPTVRDERLPLLISGKFFADLYRSPSSNQAIADHFSTMETKGPWFTRYNYVSRTTPSGLPFTQATPLDYRGMMTIGVDTTGAPLYTVLTHKNHLVNQIHSTQQDYDPDEPLTNPYTRFLKANLYDIDLGVYALRGADYRTATSATNDNTQMMKMWKNTDAPYSPLELEAVLREFDSDSPYLPQRLRDWAGVKILSENKHLVTTESWNTPVIQQNLASTTNLNDLAPENRGGLPFDMLRLAFLGGVDASGNVKDASMGDYTNRQRVAMYIYKLLEAIGSVDMGGTGTTPQQRNAQWAVNVVDFFDASDIITPFEYETGKWVYGCKRPEILISETVAFHSRNTEDDPSLEGGEKAGGKNMKAPSGDGDKDDDTVYEEYKWDDNEANIVIPNRTPETITKIKDKMRNMPAESRPDGTMDLDQRLRPQGTLLIELFNPWTNSRLDSVQETGYRQEPPGGSLWDTDKNGVELSKVTGGDPVWRILVMAGDFNAADKDDPDELLHNGSGNVNGSVERVINLGSSLATRGITNADVLVFSGGTAGGAVLPPGEHAVLGPEGCTALSFEESTDAAVVEPTRHLEIENSGITLDGVGLNVVSIPIETTDKGARLSLTERGEYPTDTDSKYHVEEETLAISNNGEPVIFDKPFDSYDTTQWSILAKNDLVSSFRKIHLQRLANPNMPWDAKTNPYITVDSMAVDLYTYNARSKDSEVGMSSGQQLSRIVTRKRGQSLFKTHSDISMLWKQEGFRDKTFESDCDFMPVSGAPGAFSGDFAHAFGNLGRSSMDGRRQPFETYQKGEGPTGMPKKPMPWLTWLNRPPVSPSELMLVTNCSPSQLLREIRVETAGTSGADPLMGYLPKFVGKPDRLKVLEYFRVPTLQMVSPMLLNGSATATGLTNMLGGDTELPFAYYSMYREPGKININTIYSEKVFRGLMARPNLAMKVYDPVMKGDLWESFLESRCGAKTADPWKMTRPFRAIGVSPAESVLRLSGSEYGLFENVSTDSTVLWNNTNNQAFFRYQNYSRLLNMVTTRSSVFAVWITVGLFEVDINGNLIESSGKYVEYGADSGNQKRFRGFYLIDRSIPVGYIRGKNLNVDKAIILRRFL